LEATFANERLRAAELVRQLEGAQQEKLRASVETTSLRETLRVASDFEESERIRLEADCRRKDQRIQELERRQKELDAKPAVSQSAAVQDRSRLETGPRATADKCTSVEGATKSEGMRRRLFGSSGGGASAPPECPNYFVSAPTHCHPPEAFGNIVDARSGQTTEPAESLRGQVCVGELAQRIFGQPQAAFGGTGGSASTLASGAPRTDAKIMPPSSGIATAPVLSQCHSAAALMQAGRDRGLGVSASASVDELPPRGWVQNQIIKNEKRCATPRARSQTPRSGVGVSAKRDGGVHSVETLGCAPWQHGQAPPGFGSLSARQPAATVATAAASFSRLRQFSKLDSAKGAEGESEDICYGMSPVRKVHLPKRLEGVVPAFHSHIGVQHQPMSYSDSRRLIQAAGSLALSEPPSPLVDNERAHHVAAQQLHNPGTGLSAPSTARSGSSSVTSTAAVGKWASASVVGSEVSATSVKDRVRQFDISRQ